ncbi:MAG: M20/M25/M40 family metallo-hydrolase [Eubacteriales bacterium]|nr:M20/M25/M40 family metallo-hydrolase [Eubacteriales bacterium]
MEQRLETFVKEHQDEVKGLLWELCKIPAPSHYEERRAAFIKEWLENQGAKGVFIDEAKNVIYPYRYEEGKPTALFMAHTDTVFPDMESMGVREEGGKMFSPGVGDDTANVAILLLMAKYAAQYQPETKGNLIFAANSCEEGLGNLKGSKALVKRYQDSLAQVVSFDGYIDEVCNCAVGSTRYRVEVKTEGGHSYFNFGNRNALAELAAMIQELYKYQVPQDGSKTTYNVGVVKGGTSVNTIAQQAEMLYEFRSDNLESMALVRENFERVVADFRNKGLEVNVEIMGERPCGRKDAKNPAQEALSNMCRDIIAKHSGRMPGFTSASTDCNIPFSLGIPAATIGLCLGGQAHTREEWIYTDSLKTGFAIAAELISEQFQ